MHIPVKSAKILLHGALLSEEQAIKLLARKQKPVAQVAAECGFASTNSFYKAFKRSYGKAPTENLISPNTQSEF